MKVGTDSVLLGSLLEAEDPQHILDIGTGTGLLALMLAQRFEQSIIDAVEIDNGAVAEALFNVRESKWNDRITVHHQSLQVFESESKKYDLIVSNPPYYKSENNYKIDTEQRSKARQTETLSFDDLVKAVAHLLTDQGICWMVLPAIESELLFTKAREAGLYPNHQIFVHAKLSKAFNRVIFSLTKAKGELQKSTFVIYQEDGTYTQQYTKATMPFLLWEGLS